MLLTKILSSGFTMARNVGFGSAAPERIQSIVEVRDCVIIVTDFAIYRAIEVDSPVEFVVQKIVDL